MSTLLNRPQNYSHRAARRTHALQPSPARNLDPAMEPVPDWAKLARKDDVSLYLGGEELASGRVDMRAIDGSVLWIIQHDGRGRVMFLHSDGATAFRRPAKNDKPLKRVFYKA